MWFGIREANEDDFPEIYKYIHKNFIKKYTDLEEKSAFIQHYIWYKKAFNSKEHKIFVIYDIDKKFIGQIRYEIYNIEAKVGIFLIEEVRDRKISKEALEESIKLLIAENNRIKKIVANILKENEVSVALFKKCDFKYSGKNGEMLKFIKLV